MIVFYYWKIMNEFMYLMMRYDFIMNDWWMIGNDIEWIDVIIMFEFD